MLLNIFTDLCSYTFYAMGMSDMQKVRKAVFMFADLFGLERYDYSKLVSFLVTVKSNYRSAVLVSTDAS